MGRPRALLYFPCWSEGLLGLFGSGAGAGCKLFVWAVRPGALGSRAGGGGAPGAEVPPAFKSAPREHSQPLPRARSDSPACRPGRRSAHIWPPRSHTDGTLTPAPRCSRGQGSPRNRRAGPPPGGSALQTGLQGSRLGRLSRGPREASRRGVWRGWECRSQVGAWGRGVVTAARGWRRGREEGAERRLGAGAGVARTWSMPRLAPALSPSHPVGFYNPNPREVVRGAGQARTFPAGEGRADPAGGGRGAEGWVPPSPPLLRPALRSSAPPRSLHLMGATGVVVAYPHEALLAFPSLPT